MSVGDTTKINFRPNRRHATPTDRCQSAVGVVPLQNPRHIAICPQNYATEGQTFCCIFQLTVLLKTNGT